jgi:hypothetical protein
MALVVALTLMAVPWVLPVPAWSAYVVAGVVAFGVVCYLGKLLYDTLFFEHYWP